MKSKSLIKPFLAPLAVLLASGNAFAAPITALSVSGSGTYSNSPALINDGAIPLQGSAWADATNVYWNGTVPTFTLDYGATYKIDGVVVSVDNNDDYSMQWSADNATWNTLFNISQAYGEVGWGMDTLSSVTGDPQYAAGMAFTPVQARYLRISATGGDHHYSVGEVQAFGSPVPIPAAAWLFGSGLAGLMGVARRRNRAAAA